MNEWKRVRELKKLTKSMKERERLASLEAFFYSIDSNGW